MIKVNLNKAKEIQKEKIREVRNPLLQKLDVDFVKALEVGANTSFIIEQKQKLRDVTNIVTEATIVGSTVGEITKELKELWDDELLGPRP